MDPQRKVEALRLLAEGVGAADVARRLDVPAGTVRSWAHRAAKAAPVSTSPLDSPRWTDEVEQLARATFAAAVRALAEFSRQVEEGRATNAKNAAIAQGVLIDQVEKLRRIAAEMGEQEVRLAHEQARQLADIIRRFLEDVGLSLEPGGAVAKVLRHHLMSAAGGESLSPAPHAADAKRAIRAQLRRELQAHPPQLRPGD